MPKSEIDMDWPEGEVDGRLSMDWTTALPRLAKAAHNAHMAGEWNDLPPDGIERAAWLQVAAAVVNEMQAMMDEREQSV